MEMVVTIQLFITMDEMPIEQAVADLKQLDDSELWEIAHGVSYKYEASQQ
jgi:hypothetical protein